MALNREKIKLLFNKFDSAESRTFSSISNQLFNYLSTEVKDNPVYDMYENDRKKWENWPRSSEQNHFISWSLPETLDEVKSLTYDIYKSIGEQGDNGSGLSFLLFREKSLSDNISRLNNTFIEYLGDILNDIIIANPEIENSQPKRQKGDCVFIIHGHDELLKREVQLLLQKAGVNNVVLHEQPDKGRTIIDKLIGETKSSGYAIALFTPDDETAVGNKRARQNVILEVGYFIGLLGKERLRMIVQNDIEIPSDLQGILYEKYDPAGAWKIKLLKEIQAVGIYVDLENAIKTF